MSQLSLIKQDTKKLMLTFKQRFELANLLTAEYIARHEIDPVFAKYATEKLGFTINANHVMHMRLELGIPSTKARRLDVSKKTGTVLARLEALEAEVAKLKEMWK